MIVCIARTVAGGNRNLWCFRCTTNIVHVWIFDRIESDNFPSLNIDLLHARYIISAAKHVYPIFDRVNTKPMTWHLDGMLYLE